MTTHPALPLGAPVPDVSLLRADGSRWQLGEQRGRTVVLVFHRHLA